MSGSEGGRRAHGQDPKGGGAGLRGQITIMYIYIYIYIYTYNQINEYIYIYIHIYIYIYVNYMYNYLCAIYMRRFYLICFIAVVNILVCF